MAGIDGLTIGEVKQLVTLFGGATSAECLWEVGKAYLIRTVTMTLTGRLVAVTEHELALEDAAWIADTGQFADALRTGEVCEVEPFPNGRILVGRGSVVDACGWEHPLPRGRR